MVDRTVPYGIIPGEPEELENYKPAEYGVYLACELENGERFELCAQRQALRDCILEAVLPARAKQKIFQTAVPVFLYSGASFFISVIKNDEGVRMPKRFYLPKLVLIGWINPKTGNSWKEGTGPDGAAQAALPKNEPAPIDIDDGLPFELQ